MMTLNSVIYIHLTQKKLLPHYPRSGRNKDLGADQLVQFSSPLDGGNIEQVKESILNYWHLCCRSHVLVSTVQTSLSPVGLSASLPLDSQKAAMEVHGALAGW